MSMVRRFDNIGFADLPEVSSYELDLPLLGSEDDVDLSGYEPTGPTTTRGAVDPAEDLADHKPASATTTRGAVDPAEMVFRPAAFLPIRSSTRIRTRGRSRARRPGACRTRGSRRSAPARSSDDDLADRQPRPLVAFPEGGRP